MRAATGRKCPLRPRVSWGITRVMEKANTVWWVYIIRTADDRLYSGVATDVERRFREHLAGGVRAARYLKAHPPRSLVFSMPIGTRSEAQKVEYHLKRLSRNRKESIICRKCLVFDAFSGRIGSAPGPGARPR